MTTERPRKLNRLSPQRQAQHDQLLAAFRDAEPHGLLTQEAGRAITRPCPCQTHPPRLGGRCYACDGAGVRGFVGSEVMPLLYQLEKRGQIVGERARPGSAMQNRWRLAPGVEVPEADEPELEAWWDALAGVADALAEVADDLHDEPAPADPAPLVAEWRALDEQRAEQLALAEGSREAQDDLVDELTALLGSRKAAAEALGVPPHTVNNATSRAAWRRIKRQRGEA